MIKIMIIEDEKWMHDMLIRQLNNIDGDFEVIAQAYDGQEALELILSLNPDIVISDIMVPNMTGLELLIYLREQSNRTAFIFISGYDRFDFVQTALNYDAYGYLLKPVNSLELKTMILRLITYLKNQDNYDYPSDDMNNHLAKDFYEELLVKIKEYIRNYYFQDINVESLAREFSFHPVYFGKIFKENTGLNFTSYLTNIRINKAKELLLDIHNTISDVAKLTGYQDAKYFSKVFKKEVGILPSKYGLNRFHNHI